MLRKLLRPKTARGKARLAALVGLLGAIVGLPLSGIFPSSQDDHHLYIHQAVEANTNDPQGSLVLTNR